MVAAAVLREATWGSVWFRAGGGIGPNPVCTCLNIAVRLLVGIAVQQDYDRPAQILRKLGGLGRYGWDCQPNMSLNHSEHFARSVCSKILIILGAFQQASFFTGGSASNFVTVNMHCQTFLFVLAMFESCISCFRWFKYSGFRDMDLRY